MLPPLLHAGGGQDNTASSSGATSNAAANTNVTVNASSAASHQAVADAERNAAAAQQRAMELQVRAVTQRAELEEARRRAAEAEAVANAQQSEIAQQQAIEIKKKLTELQDKYDALLQEIADVQAEIITIEQTPPSPTPIEVEQVTIPSCDQNAVPVRDPETNLLLVCESQIITGNQTADVGTQKHASGRYYVLPFPDHSMMVVGKKAAYKYACGQHFCEWLKVGGSLDIEYGAASKDDKFYRFTSCRTGLESKRICAVPLSEFPDGVPSSFDGREPEPVKVGAKIDSSDVSGVARFRAGAPTKSPAACATLKNDALVLPWL